MATSESVEHQVSAFYGELGTSVHEYGMREARRVSEFYRDLLFRQHLVNQFRRTTDLYLAEDFTVFDYIVPDERKLSRIFRDLLDPTGAHGQGDKFLIEFLMISNRLEWKLRFQSVKKEGYFSGGKGQIDILIDFGSAGIGIENKPFAGDGERQMQKYAEALQERYADQFLLIYLTPEGVAPSESSMPQSMSVSLEKVGKLGLWSYTGLFTSWLLACRRVCEAERIRDFLLSLVRFIEGRWKTAFLDAEVSGNEGQLEEQSDD